MKRIFKLLTIILLLIAIIPHQVYAKEKILEIDFSKYYSYYDMPIINEIYMELCIRKNVLIDETDDSDNHYYANVNGKRLIQFNNETGEFRVLEEAGERDTLEYTLTTEDKEDLEFPEDLTYDKIVIKFGPQDFEKEDYLFEVKEGLLVENNSLVIEVAMRFFPRENILNVRNELIIKNLSGKVLMIYNIGSQGPKVFIPDDVTKEDDIIYNLSEEEKESLNNEYNKIIINYSGFNYSNEENAYIVDAKDSIMMITEDYLSRLIYNIQKNNVVASPRYVFESIVGKDLAYVYMNNNLYDEQNSNTMNELFIPIIIPEGVGEEDTIIYNIPDDSELRNYFPSNIKRIITKFIKKEQEEEETPIEEKPIIVNPKTLHTVGLVFSVIILFTMFVSFSIFKIKRRA